MRAVKKKGAPINYGGAWRKRN